ncbi:hypothetical protein FAGAP_4341 [Fusarium agapanthi]|uniref:Uncharacterized protein n=1 Tax=Fusarium agapanthi TaxID=1803897 RepID=A0A9P5EFZ2_9HYPO|nr:hypothetical protein FAGAP_4341 [Fusarium agapanthi]
MADSPPVEFPSLSDSRLPSGEQDRQILRQLKNFWDQHSNKWDDETKHEFVDHIVKGYTKVTKTNQSQPSGHRLWKAGHMTFATWIIFRATYDEDKLSKPREWLRTKYKNIDPQSWASPMSKKPVKPRGTKGEKARSSEENLPSQEPKSPQSIETMEICDNESDYDDIHGDGTYKDGNNDGDDEDETNGKAVTRSRFKAVNVPEPSRDLSRKRGTSSASLNLRTKLQKLDFPRTPSSAEAVRLLEASNQPATTAVDSQARSRTLKWKTKLHEHRDSGRGLNQNRPVLNRAASTGDQASLPNPTATSFAQNAYDQNAFRPSVNPSRQWARSQERSSRLSAPVVSYEKVDDQSVSEDPRDRIPTRGHSTQSDHVRVKFGLVDQRPGESGASTQRLPRSIECRGNTSTMVTQGSSDSFVFSSSSHVKEHSRTGEPLPLRLTTRESLGTPGDVFTQQPSGLQQLPLDDPDEPSWFRQFRTQYYSDQKETREVIAYHIKRQVTGVVFQAVHDLIQPLSNSITQCVDTLANRNANTAGVTEHIGQAVSAAKDLRDMKQILSNIVDTSRVQLEASQTEGAAIQGLLLPAITEHRKDIDDLSKRTTSIEERTSDVEEYLELQLAYRGGDSTRNATQVDENNHHAFGNHENAGGE